MEAAGPRKYLILLRTNSQVQKSGNVLVDNRVASNDGHTLFYCDKIAMSKEES